MSRKCFRLAAIVALFAPATLMGQMPRDTGSQRRAPDKNATHIMIPTFVTVERARRPNIGVQAAEEMRRQVADAFSPKEVYVIPSERMVYGFHDGLFSAEELALEPYDAKALATMLRAGEYIMGSIERTSEGEFRVQAELVLTRDLNARQPLGVATSRKMNDAIEVLVREMKEARKQLDGERKCVAAEREGKGPEAIEFARAAIALYPKATLARMCLLKALGARFSQSTRPSHNRNADITHR